MAKLSRRAGVLVLLLLVLEGCGSLRPTCDLAKDQRELVLRRVADRIAEIESESIGFDIDMALHESGLSRLRSGQCYAYLYPVSKIEGQSILDGDGGIYVDPMTLELGEVFWFSY